MKKDKQLVTDVPIRDALHNLKSNTGASPDYCRGMIIGMWCTLISLGWKFSDIVSTIKRCLPDEYREECLPHTLREELK